MGEDPHWLTLEEAASHVGLGVRTFTRLVRRGEVPSIFDRKRRRLLIHKGNLDLWVEQHRIKPGSLAHLDSNHPKYRRGRAG